MTVSLSSYPKIYSLGHKAIKDLFLDKVVIEEKVDGSQFSFAMIDGDLRIRSKGQAIDLTNPPKMFLPAVQTVCSLAEKGLLHNAWVYRGEAICSRKHNSLCYDRVPDGYIALFDVEVGIYDFLPYSDKLSEAERLGIGVVPFIASVSEGTVSPEWIKNKLQLESFLGGQKIEGLVFKNYHRFGDYGYPLFGKFVSEEFKETNKKEWRANAANHQDIITLLGAKYRTIPRWEKAIQHLRDSGQLEDSPKDIGKLIVEICRDVFEECQSDIGAELLAFFKKKIQSQLTNGFPEYYKERLMNSQFDEEDT